MRYVRLNECYWNHTTGVFMIPQKVTLPKNLIKRGKWISVLSMSSVFFSAMIITFEALPADIKNLVPEGFRSFLAMGALLGSGLTSIIHKTIYDDVNPNTGNENSS